MKRAILVAGLALTAAHLAGAKLGDNYAAACKQYGGRGTADKDWVHWKPIESNPVCETWAMFKDNRCVAIQYVSNNGLPWVESEVWRMLSYDSNGDYWHSYGTDENGTHFYSNKDFTKYARWMNGGRLIEITYKNWIDRHMGWKSGSDNSEIEPPPVQESTNPPADNDSQRRKLSKGEYGV
jgi:hypothetical protein